MQYYLMLSAAQAPHDRKNWSGTPKSALSDIGLPELVLRLGLASLIEWTANSRVARKCRTSNMSEGIRYVSGWRLESQAT